MGPNVTLQGNLDPCALYSSQVSSHSFIHSFIHFKQGPYNNTDRQTDKSDDTKTYANLKEHRQRIDRDNISTTCFRLFVIVLR